MFFFRFAEHVPLFKALRNVWFGLFISVLGDEPETRELHSELI